MSWSYLSPRKQLTRSPSPLDFPFSTDRLSFKRRISTSLIVNQVLNVHVLQERGSDIRAQLCDCVIY